MGQAKVFMTGRISNDPKTYGDGNKTRLLFNVACNYLVPREDGSKEQRTDFHTLVLWGENRVKSLKPWLLKGRLIEVTGTLQNYERRNDEGEWVRKDTSIVVNTLEFLDRKPENVKTKPADSKPVDEMSKMVKLMQEMMAGMQQGKTATATPPTSEDELPY